MYAWNYHKVLLVGSSGSGKTHTAMNHYMRKANRLMVIDTNCEIAVKTGLPYTRNIKEWSPDKFPCYYPRDYSIEHLDLMIKRVRCFTNVQLFLDDLDSFTGGSHACGKELIAFMVNARHQNIGIIIANKTPNNIDKRIVQNSHFVHLWNQNAKYAETILDWNLSLNHPNPDELFRLSAHTFAFFAPQGDNIDSTDPKKFVGYFN